MSLQLDSATVQAAQRRLDVLGNNIANVNTVGFKGASFDAMLGSAMGTTGSSQTSGTVQNFSQGNVTSTNNPLDIAISGTGLFKLKSSSGQEVYTRDGQFSLNQSGEIVNSSGDKLLGSDNNKIVIDVNEINPKNTTTKATLGLTLDSRKDPITTTFNLSDPTTYTHSTTTPIYDDSGTLKNVQTFYAKTSATDWDVYYAINGVVVNDATGPLKSRLSFDSSGTINTTASQNLTASVPINIDPLTGLIATGSTSTMAVDLTSAKQFGASFAATMTQDGYPSGQMTGYKVGGDGVITAVYSNGKTAVKGQLNIVTFKNLQGLAATGTNQWIETPASGAPITGLPGTLGLGTLKGSSTEDSNVDLTVEMIKLISAQRAFQSAAEVVKKQDEILQGVVHIGQ
jgi:flagellar hook protein FlgE